MSDFWKTMILINTTLIVIALSVCLIMTNDTENEIKCFKETKQSGCVGSHITISPEVAKELYK